MFVHYTSFGAESHIPCTGHASPAYHNAACCGTISAVYLLPVALALETKMADANVEYKLVDLQSYEAHNGASLAQLFKCNF